MARRRLEQQSHETLPLPAYTMVTAHNMIYLSKLLLKMPLYLTSTRHFASKLALHNSAYNTCPPAGTGITAHQKLYECVYGYGERTGTLPAIEQWLTTNNQKSRLKSKIYWEIMVLYACPRIKTTVMTVRTNKQ